MTSNETCCSISTFDETIIGFYEITCYWVAITIAFELPSPTWWKWHLFPLVMLSQILHAYRKQKMSKQIWLKFKKTFKSKKLYTFNQELLTPPNPTTKKLKMKPSLKNMKGHILSSLNFFKEIFQKS
jgi:hypothetical protein